MKKIQVLDCTLRDGGYVNNWQFGAQAIHDIRHALDRTGVTIAELGFMRNEAYQPDRAVYSSTAQVAEIIGEKDSAMLFAGLIEMANYFPEPMLAPADPAGPEAIRYSFWKRKIDEAYDYCAHIKEKGYLLCCQPTRVEQYSDADFARMCRQFSKLKPYAVYIVDTFGLLQKKDLLRYAQIGHDNLDERIVLGYHAHDNMGQAFGNACAFLEMDLDRTLQVDASMCGIGRGAGNLKLELILQYLNDFHGGSYDLTPIYQMWDQHLGAVKQAHPWGFELPYFIAAAHACNPNYAIYFMDAGMTVAQIAAAIQGIEGQDKYLFSPEKARYYREQVTGV